MSRRKDQQSRRGRRSWRDHIQFSNHYLDL